MGKIARILAVAIGFIASLFGPACDPWVTEHGDKQGKGERAMALLGSIFLGILMIVGTCAYHELANPLDSGQFVTMILLSVPVGIVPYILWDRGISRRERERAEATQAQKSPGSPG
jgi:drug/metabolite transporter (DMT)-like permease